MSGRESFWHTTTHEKPSSPNSTVKWIGIKKQKGDYFKVQCLKMQMGIIRVNLTCFKIIMLLSLSNLRTIQETNSWWEELKKKEKFLLPALSTSS